MTSAHHKLTEEQESYLREHAPKESRAQLAEGFNATFGTSYAKTTVTSWCNKRGLHNGNDGRFKDGHRSWQTGLQGEEYRKHYTDESWEKSKGGLVFAEQKYQEGDLIIRHGLPAFYKGGDVGVELDDRIEYASTAVWERANGKLSDDMKLIHLDGDIMNYNLDNLRAIPKSWLADLRYTGGLTDNRELNEAKLRYCALRAALRERRIEYGRNNQEFYD
jgi:hypothetical protein